MTDASEVRATIKAFRETCQDRKSALRRMIAIAERADQAQMNLALAVLDEDPTRMAKEFYERQKAVEEYEEAAKLHDLALAAGAAASKAMNTTAARYADECGLTSTVSA